MVYLDLDFEFINSNRLQISRNNTLLNERVSHYPFCSLLHQKVELYEYNVISKKYFQSFDIYNKTPAI